MTIAIKPTATTATIEHNDSTILTVDSSGNITPSNDLYPKVPAFRARKSSDQSITTATITKVTFDTEDFDTTSDFASSKFTPSVAGYYQVNVVLRCEGSSQTQQILWLYKNGSSYSILGFDREANTIHLAGSDLIYLNGSTDYIEMYGRVDATSPAFGGDTATNTCAFSAHLVSV
jgi:hypothetical protein